MVHITTSNVGESAGSAPLGSFVYAMPDVSLLKMVSLKEKFALTVCSESISANLSARRYALQVRVLTMPQGLQKFWPAGRTNLSTLVAV